jgi:phosphate/phosphite/phosphonate ABC transporter binding protein
MKIRHLIFFFLFVLLTVTNLNADQNEINFVVLANRGHKQAYDRWKPLADYLQEKTGYKFNLIPFDFNQIEDSLRKDQADIIVSTSVYFVKFQDKYKVKSIATLKNSDSSSYFCGVIISKKDSNIKKLEDLKGKKIAAVSYDSTCGYLVQSALLKQHNIDVNEVANIWVAENEDNIVYAVYNGAFQAGFLNAGIFNDIALEKKLNLDSFNIINARRNQGLDYICSTDTWPHWPLYVKKDFDPQKQKMIQDALFNIANDVSLQEKTGLYGFVPPLDYSVVKKAMDLMSGIEPASEEQKSLKKK